MILLVTLLSHPPRGAAFALPPPFVCGTQHTHPGSRPSCLPVDAKRGRPPPPPDMAADPKPGMIAEIQGSPAVKNLALQHAFGSCPVVQSVQENAGCSLFPPSWSSPAFLLPAAGPMPPGARRTSENSSYPQYECAPLQGFEAIGSLLCPLVAASVYQAVLRQGIKYRQKPMLLRFG
jgi:hypothetical protein